VSRGRAGSRRRRRVAGVVAVLGLTVLGVTAPAARLASAADAPAAGGYAPVIPGLRVDPDRDAGAHPEFRTEWWYVTGWLEDAAGHEYGFQVTFFRTRPELDRANPSAFAARQILIAHAALLAPPATGLQSWHEERIAREGFGLARADTARLAVAIEDWSLEEERGNYRARVVAEGGAGLVLTLVATAPPLLNGVSGYSQKGPAPASASYYVSVPQLGVSGEIRARDANGRSVGARPVRGRAWLDHEWSSSYLDAAASGWDWVGLNLADGGALMAFRIRDRTGGAHYAGATRRGADGAVEHFGPAAVRFLPGREWRSPLTGTRYPVEWTVEVGTRRYRLSPLLDDQEADTRRTTGAVYWEGAVRSRAEGDADGRGFLELTGYGAPLVLPGSAP
jgi:predicted secreted hydrolase